MDLFTAAVQDSARAAALWGGLLILLLITLSGLVVRQRQRLRIGYGDGEAPELMAASRAFGNAAEYAPAGMAALALMAMVGVHALADARRGRGLLARAPHSRLRPQPIGGGHAIARRRHDADLHPPAGHRP